jgi:hypothetical protein
MFFLHVCSFNIFQKTPKRIFKLLYDVAAEILQKPNNVVLAFMHILHLKKSTGRLLLALMYAILWLLLFAW